MPASLLSWKPAAGFEARINLRGPVDPVGTQLLFPVGQPAGGPGECKDWREQVGGDAELAGFGGDEAGHPVVAVDDVGFNTGDDVVDGIYVPIIV